MAEGAFAHPAMVTEEMFQGVKSTLSPPYIGMDDCSNILTMVHLQNLFYSAALVCLPSYTYHDMTMYLPMAHIYS